MDSSRFCNPFDEVLAHGGAPAVFLRDREGLWRFDAEWTRDAWERSPGPHTHALTWTLFRDAATGFVVPLLCTSPTLLTEHPRGDVRRYPSEDEAEAARAAVGNLPIASAPW